MKQFTVSDAPDQQFGTILGNRRVTIRLRYNPTSKRWSLDLSVDDTPVLHGKRIVPGVDLLEPYNFGIGKIFAIATVAAGSPADGRSSLPSGRVRLYHATDEEYEEVLRSFETGIEDSTASQAEIATYYASTQ